MTTRLHRVKHRAAVFAAALFSGLFDEFLGAFGTGDGDLALALGNSYRLAATGTFKVPMLPIPQPLPKTHIAAIFPIALIGIAGKTAADRPNHQAVGQDSTAQLHRCKGQEHTRQSQDHAGCQDRRIEFVRAVTPSHKIAQPRFQLASQAA